MTLRVAVIGSRGMPGVHGGIERHVEELYPRLVERGVEVTVYARRAYVPHDTEHAGVRVVSLGSLPGRYGEAISHTALSMWHARRAGYDLLHVHAIGPGLLLPLAALLGFRRTIFTFHAPDYEQAKWGRVAKAVLRVAEHAAVRTATEVIAVSAGQTNRLRRKYRRFVHNIPNGPGCMVKRPPGALLARLGLRGGDYVLSVGRLIPSKRLEDLIVAMASVPEYKAVFAGDSSHTDEYARRLKAEAGAQALFPGYMYGEDLEELYSNALAYVLPSEVEGLSISLLEAMAFRLPVIVSDIPGNVEALGDPPAGIICPLGNRRALAQALKTVVASSSMRRDLGERAAARVRRAYDWETIASRTLAVYERTMATPPCTRMRSLTLP